MDKDHIKKHLESIIQLSEEIKRHEESLLLGEWFNLKLYCLDPNVNLSDLYKKASELCGWDKHESI